MIQNGVQTEVRPEEAGWNPGVGRRPRGAPGTGAAAAAGLPALPIQLVTKPPAAAEAGQRGASTCGMGAMIGSSPAIRRVFDRIARVAPTSSTVLVLGESGTGKELAAQAVHMASERRDKPMVAVNCGAISASLIESELFGHERGSFTGADRIHRGHFERADGGTLFLDEIDEMPVGLQVKLLRVLESGTFMRVGGDKPLRVDVRIIAAAKPGIEAAVADGRFRSDLLYRLKVFPIALPLLRERAADLQLLVRHFLLLLNRAGETEKRLTPGALALLLAHDWPGNVRELKHVLESAYILADHDIDSESLIALPDAKPAADRTETAKGPFVELAPGMPLAHAERQFVLATLVSAGGNKRRTAEALKISLKTLYTRLREYQASGHWAAEAGGTWLQAGRQN